MSTLDNGRMRQGSFLVIIVGLGILIFWHVYPFFAALLGATTFYILFRKRMFYLVSVRKNRKGLSALLIMLLSFIIVVLPIGIVVKLLYDKLMVLLANPEDWVARINTLAEDINRQVGMEIISNDSIKNAPQALAKIVPNVLMATLDTLIIVSLLYFVLYFMLTNGREMEKWLYEHIPLKDANVKKMGDEVVNMVVSNAVGIPLLALIQAIFAFGAYWVLGVPDPVLWGAVTAFAAMLPVIGSTAVWFPLSLFLYFSGQEWQGIVLWFYGVIVIINIDNVMRLVLQKRLADVHPLITMFGVIIGISLFGFMGLVFGPLLLSMFILLLQIYYDEFLGKKRESAINTDTEPKKKKKLPVIRPFG